MKNILDFYYDLDYLLFRNTILKSILIDFKIFHEKIKTEYGMPESFAEAFAQSLFLQKFIFYPNEVVVRIDNIPMKTDDDRANQIEKTLQHLENKIQSLFKSNFYSLSIHPVNEIKMFVFTTFESEKYNIIFEIIANKNSKLFDSKTHPLTVKEGLKNFIRTAKELALNESFFKTLGSEELLTELRDCISSFPKINLPEAQKIWKEIENAVIVSNNF